MKITCNKESLIKILTQTERVVSKNPALPVLSDVLISPFKNNNEIVISATNLDLGVNFLLKAKIEGEKKKIAIKAGALAQFLSNISTEREVLLEIEGNTLAVKTKSGNAKFAGSEAEDFPVINKLDSEPIVSLEAIKITEGIKSVIYSVSNSQIKPELAGVFVYLTGDDLVFVSTDSFRLAEKKIKIKKPKEDFDGFIIPTKNILEIGRVLEGEEGIFDIRVGGGQVSFSKEGVYLVSRSVEGNFPDYKQIIPKEQKTEAVFLKEDLVRSLKASTVFSDSFNQITFCFKPKEKSVEISSKNSGVGEGDIKISSALSGEDIQIGFNHKYIVDCLGSIKSDSVSVFLFGVGKPAILRGVSDSSFMYLVMPMNR